MSMSKQEVFDKVAWHMLAQGHKSQRRAGAFYCCYRGDNGDKCAAGCLIPDELYYDELEGDTVTTPEVIHVLQEAGVLPPHAGDGTNLVWLIRQLQVLHDNVEPEFWCKELELLAAKHQLHFSSAPPLAVLPPFPSDEAELAERNAHYDAITAINKASAVERKTLTTAE